MFDKFQFICEFNCTHFLMGVRKLYQNRYLDTNKNKTNQSFGSFFYYIYKKPPFQTHAGVI
jgi:hypothetical protein